MKMKKLIAVFVSITLIVMQAVSMSAISSAASTEPKQEDVFLSEFFELSLSEIETELGDWYSPTKLQNGMIMVGVTRNQLQKLLSELEQRRAQITDIDCFRQAFYELFLEKLHLKGIYEIADPSYRDASCLIDNWNYNNIQNQYTALTIEEGSMAPICLRFPNYTSSEYPFSIDYQGETKKLSVYEMTKRALYVILKYGDRDYYEDAHEETPCGSVLPEMITDVVQMREMLTAYVEENQIEARIVSDEEYPGYQPIVVEFDGDKAPDAGDAVFDYIDDQNMDRTKIGMVRIVDGVAVTTATGTVMVTLNGDVDCNGAVQIADAVLLARYLAEDDVIITAQGLQNAELDGNAASLDAGDFTGLLQMIAGVE